MEVVMSADMATFFNRIGKGHRRTIISNLLLLIPGIAADFVIHSNLIKKVYLTELLSKLDEVYLTVIGILICNSLQVSLLCYLGLIMQANRIFSQLLIVCWENAIQHILKCWTAITICVIRMHTLRL